MLKIVTGRNYSESQAELDAFYVLRHKLYVDARGWTGLAKPDGRERDQFDDGRSHYVLSLDPDGRVVGGARLRRSTDPHLLADVFSHLAEFGPVPRDAQTWELTRYCAIAGARSEYEVATEVLLGFLEHLTAQNAAQLTFVCDTFWIKPMFEWGWMPSGLGLPHPYAEGVCIGIRVPVDARMIATTRAARARGTQEKIRRVS